MKTLIILFFEATFIIITMIYWNIIMNANTIHKIMQTTKLIFFI